MNAPKPSSSSQADKEKRRIQLEVWCSDTPTQAEAAAHVLHIQPVKLKDFSRDAHLVLVQHGKLQGEVHRVSAGEVGGTDPPMWAIGAEMRDDSTLRSAKHPSDLLLNDAVARSASSR